MGVAADEQSSPARERMTELHQRLVWTFTTELATFERKLYVSLSHEANKAMNLNSYIGLMGGSYRQESTPDGFVLRPTDKPGHGDLTVPDSEYLLTLDADSILLREYCLRLVYLLEQPDNARVAVTQTPYSSFRGAGTRIERLAGATTDLQHILHQGMSHFGATFWVGANAVIRKRALEDIVETEMVGGFEIRRYVQDRTVIEDTESSVDLGTHGWSLVNYPERLSYSATPPDFGSLIVQRRRWANGGLLILPKLWRQASERRRLGERLSRVELLLRINYMASIAWASFGLVFLLVYPYDSRLLSPIVLVAALPYFLAMGSDLKSCGYRFTDIFRIYGFNLILLPVNLAGVLGSLQQAITGRKIPFARTPKVKNRTATAPVYVLAPLLIVAFSVLTGRRDVLAENWGNAAFAALNATLALLGDRRLHRHRQLHRRPRRRASPGGCSSRGNPAARVRSVPAATPALDWQSGALLTANSPAAPRVPWSASGRARVRRRGCQHQPGGRAGGRYLPFSVRGAGAAVVAVPCFHRGGGRVRVDRRRGGRVSEVELIHRGRSNGALVRRIRRCHGHPDLRVRGTDYAGCVGHVAALLRRQLEANDACTPSWGAAFTLDEASASTWSLDRQHRAPGATGRGNRASPSVASSMTN